MTTGVWWARLRLCSDIHSCWWAIKTASIYDCPRPLLPWHMCSNCNFNQLWNRRTCWPQHKGDTTADRATWRYFLQKYSLWGWPPTQDTASNYQPTCASSVLSPHCLASPFADCTCSGFNASGSFGTSYIFRKHIEDVNEMAWTYRQTRSSRQTRIALRRWKIISETLKPQHTWITLWNTVGSCLWWKGQVI